jgi:hypothetical protein
MGVNRTECLREACGVRNEVQETKSSLHFITVTSVWNSNPRTTVSIWFYLDHHKNQPKQLYSKFKFPTKIIATYFIIARLHNLFHSSRSSHPELKRSPSPWNRFYDTDLNILPLESTWAASCRVLHSSFFTSLSPFIHEWDFIVNHGAQSVYAYETKESREECSKKGTQKICVR